MKLSAGRRRSIDLRMRSSFGKSWKADAPGDLKERKRRKSRTNYGECWNSVGNIYRMNVQVSEPYFSAWRPQHKHHGHLLPQTIWLYCLHARYPHFPPQVSRLSQVVS